MRVMTIALRCPVCHRLDETSLVLKDRIVDFNVDKMCCGVWMVHENKRIEEKEEERRDVYARRLDDSLALDGARA